MDNFESLVRDERQRQDAKWGEQQHSPAIWLAILVEEVGEMAAPIIRFDGWKPELQKGTDLGKEIVHVAAVAKAMYESLERYGLMD